MTGPPEVKGPALLAGSARAEELTYTDSADSSDLYAFTQLWPVLSDLREIWWRARRHGARWHPEPGIIVIQGGRTDDYDPDLYDRMPF